MVDDQTIKKGIIWLLIIGVFVLAFFIIKPLFVPLAFGLIFAYIFGPVYKRTKWLVKNDTLRTLIIVILVLFLLLVPVIFFIPEMIGQATRIFQIVHNYDFNEFFSKFLRQELSQAVSANVSNILVNFINNLLNSIWGLLVNIVPFVLKTFIFLVVFFFVLRDSQKLKAYFLNLSPFSNRTQQRFLTEFRGITNAILFGQVLIGLVQGVTLFIGLFFLKVEGAVVLSIIGAILSIVPLVGAWMLWAPLSIVLIATGNTFQGVFLAIYGLLIVSTIDNILRPYLISKRSKLSVPVSIIGIIGGIMFFGITGIVLGPLILAYVLIIIEFYKEGRLNELFSRE